MRRTINIHLDVTQSNRLGRFIAMKPFDREEANLILARLAGNSTVWCFRLRCDSFNIDFNHPLLSRLIYFHLFDKNTGPRFKTNSNDTTLKKTPYQTTFECEMGGGGCLPQNSKRPYVNQINMLALLEMRI